MSMFKNLHPKQLLLALVMFLAGAAMAQKKDEPAEAKFPKASEYSKTKLTYKIINAPKKTFCYDIYADGKLMIHQPSAPGLPGNEGFKTKGAAGRVARLVIEKIKKGEMPPTIDIKEMKELKAI